MTDKRKNENMDGTNASTIEQLQEDPGFWDGVWEQIRLIYHLIRDPEVPIFLKLVPLAGLIYLISPIDLVPDFPVPVLGQLDDITILLVGAKVFIDLTPPHLVQKYMHIIRGEQHATPAMSDKESKAWEEAIIVDANHEMIHEEREQE